MEGQYATLKDVAERAGTTAATVSYIPVSYTHLVLNRLDSYKGPREGDKEWYYFEKDGVPAYLKTTARTMNGAITKILSLIHI